MLRDYDNRDTAFKGIERLFLDNNDLSQGGIQYIAQALRRNQSLRYLSMCECKIDAKDCILLGEALKYNQYLERFDIGYNPLMTPNMDGVSSCVLFDRPGGSYRLLIDHFHPTSTKCKPILEGSLLG